MSLQVNKKEYDEYQRLFDWIDVEKEVYDNIFNSTDLILKHYRKWMKVLDEKFQNLFPEQYKTMKKYGIIK